MMVDYTVNDFEINKLGSFYEDSKTIFRVFAPESNRMSLVINEHFYEMHKVGYCFEIALAGNLENIKYYYQNDNNVSFRDPFAYYSDEKYSYVLDTKKFNSEKIVPEKNKNTIIYEVNVRDFSSDESLPFDSKRKIEALTETNLKINNKPIGLDYIKRLGVSYIQLMPILDFDNDGTDYNWGYNPTAYNYINKDYINCKLNPYAFVNELRTTVNSIHNHGLRVTLDVVFNHVYQYCKFDLDCMIPGHVFRLKEDGSLANGTYCGNEIKTEDPFVREYLCFMAQRYIELFDIDGIRLDLMGIMDYETVNQMYEGCKEIKDDFILYGEGWNMGDVLDEEDRATILNADKLPNIRMFNDSFRELMISYISGNDSIRDEIKLAVAGASNPLECKNSINYVECHDNYTFFDRMNKFKKEDDEWCNVRRCKLALALVILSRGIPFIHAGQEFLRTKNFIENSYNSDEEINKLDWNLRIENNDVCEYTRSLISIRNDYADTFNGDDTNISFEDYYDCLVYRLNDLMIIINPCKWDHIYNDGKEYEILLDLDGKSGHKSDVLSIPAYSALIAKK